MGYDGMKDNNNNSNGNNINDNDIRGEAKTTSLLSDPPRRNRFPDPPSGMTT